MAGSSLSRRTYGLALLAVMGLAGGGSLALWLSTPPHRAVSLGFQAYRTAPAVVTQFAIEQPLTPIQPLIASGSADINIPRDSAGGSVLSLPNDVGGDGTWTISVEWVELPTDKAWTASATIAIEDLVRDTSTYHLLVILGPNGELLIGSDEARPDRSAQNDLARVCGTRVPAADKAWRLETGQFPELPRLLEGIDSNSAAEDGPSHCPEPRG